MPELAEDPFAAASLIVHTAITEGFLVRDDSVSETYKQEPLGGRPIVQARPCLFRRYTVNVVTRITTRVVTITKYCEHILTVNRAGRDTRDLTERADVCYARVRSRFALDLIMIQWSGDPELL